MSVITYFIPFLYEFKIIAGCAVLIGAARLSFAMTCTTPRVVGLNWLWHA